MNIKNVVKRIIGEKNLGRYDYLFKPSNKKVWGGAFNGQEFRRKIFNEICDRCDFKLIVETGTFRGNTTLYMSRVGIPIMSVEYDLRIYGYASTRFALNSAIATFKNDSRTFLKSLSSDASVAKKDVFFYLDAHWSDDLPLAEELKIIFSKWENPVIMIDDFKVPGTGYEYDDYGEGKALTLEYVRNALGDLDISVFFPAVDETKETGFRRGCVVLCNDSSLTNALSRCETLRPYEYQQS